MKTFRIFEKGRGGVAELNFDSVSIRLVEHERDTGLGIKTALERDHILRGISPRANQFGIFIQGRFGLVGPAEAHENLALVVISCEIDGRDFVRFKGDKLVELLQGILEFAGALERASQLKTDGVDRSINILGALERLDRFIELSAAQIGTT